MPIAPAYAALHIRGQLAPLTITRREPGAEDVLIEILYCGICHSDVSYVQGLLPGVAFPMVPGHEIVGRVTELGRAVTRFRVGDIVGVGCMVDSCRVCCECQEGYEQFCDGMVTTYSGIERDGKTPTYGGYSAAITVDQRYVLRVPTSLSPAGAAPLLCAGITTYSSLRHWRTGPGRRVAVIGLGGLGHIAVKLAVAMGADVTVISRSEGKRRDALRLGANDYAASAAQEGLSRLRGRFDLILNTVSASIDNDLFISLLRRDGTLVHLGVPESPLSMQVYDLLLRRKNVAGSPIGGMCETQEMLDFCGQHDITADVEVIPIQTVNEAYARILNSDVRYRFVIDMSSLR